MSQSNPTAVWYDAPASAWTAALPAGSGRIGAMVFRDITRERISLSEESIWCGRPRTISPGGPAVLARARDLLFSGKPVEAESLCEEEFLVTDPNESAGFQYLGDLEINHSGMGTSRNYRRILDLTEGIIHSTFTTNDRTLHRQTFVSEPDQVLVHQVTLEGASALSLTATLTRDAHAEVHEADRRTLCFTGHAATSDGQNKGTCFVTWLRAPSASADITLGDGAIHVKGAPDVLLLASVRTTGLPGGPRPCSAENLWVKVKADLDAAEARRFQLRVRHTRDYWRLYDGFALDVLLPDSHPEPINMRIARAASGFCDPELLVTYLDYCRYVPISASRRGTPPMRLQGIWAEGLVTPWRSDSHLSINLQKAYWFAEEVGLPECHEPLLSFIQRLMSAGSEMAKRDLGVDGGFALGLRTDGNLHTAPTQVAVWGMYVAGGAWCTQHVVEHYRFCPDNAFLREVGLPILQENAKLWVNWLTTHPEYGLLVSGPSTSPENTYSLPGGGSTSLAMGPAHDQGLAWDSLTNYLSATAELGVQSELTVSAQETLKRLALPEIGKDGRLLEWPYPYAGAEPGHRHLSHLWGIMPGNRITATKTPDLAQAVRRLASNYNAQGWSLGWAAALLVRLDELNRALDLMQREYFLHSWPNLLLTPTGTARSAT